MTDVTLRMTRSDAERFVDSVDGWLAVRQDVMLYLFEKTGKDGLYTRAEDQALDDDLRRLRDDLAARVGRARASDAWTRNSKPAVKIYNDGLLIVDVTNHTVTQGGEAVQLTPTEFRLLAALVAHPRQLLSAEQLLRLAWLDESEVGPERVKFTMCRLRKKLGWKDSAPVEAVRGFGYRFTPVAP